jgi:small subunit ribosomal protein S1
LDFKVIEFSKESKKIIVSHYRTFQDAIAEEKAANEEAESKREKNTKKAVKKLNDTLERTTLGDIDALANLKEEMEKNNQE